MCRLQYYNGLPEFYIWDGCEMGEFYLDCFNSTIMNMIWNFSLKLKDIIKDNTVNLSCLWL